MVQVDVFWAYGLGGSLAAAAGRQLRKEPRPFESRYFVATVLFLALIWAPTGLLLLLRHPSWETMQAAPSLTALPPMLVLGFGITNVTQGILGFWVGQRLMARGRYELAHLNWLAGYLGMFFILLYGWDGLGYDRFLYDRDMFHGVAWTPGAGLQPGAGPAFLTSSVAQTLYLDGLFLLPPLFYWGGRWTIDGARSDMAAAAVNPATAAPHSATARRLPSTRSVRLWYLGAILLLALPAAAALALGVHFTKRALLLAGLATSSAHVASYFIGLPAAGLALWALFFAPDRPARALIRRLFVPDTLAPPATATATTAPAAAATAPAHGTAASDPLAPASAR